MDGMEPIPYGDFHPQGCQEAVDTAAALILQRHWRRRQRLMDLKAGRSGAAVSYSSTP